MRALHSLLPWGLALALVMSAHLAAADDAPCSGHGKPDEKSGLCACDTPWPEAGAKGYTGVNCSIPVFGAAAPFDGGDLAAGCAADGCSSLESGQWVCFAAHFPWK